MYISVLHRPDFRRTVRFNLYIIRKAIFIFAVVGVLAIILGVVAEPGYSFFFIVIGVVLIIEPTVLVWVQLHRHREIVLKEAEVTVTSEGIQRRTETATLHVTWDMVKRIHELKDMWVFTVNRMTYIVLRKQDLSQEQRAELAAFITARRK